MHIPTNKQTRETERERECVGVSVRQSVSRSVPPLEVCIKSLLSKLTLSWAHVCPTTSKLRLPLALASAHLSIRRMVVRPLSTIYKDRTPNQNKDILWKGPTNFGCVSFFVPCSASTTTARLLSWKLSHEHAMAVGSVVQCDCGCTLMLRGHKNLQRLTLQLGHN